MYTRFGTTEEMVIQTVEENNATFLLAIDSTGLYMTTPNYWANRLPTPTVTAPRARMLTRGCKRHWDWTPKNCGPTTRILSRAKPCPPRRSTWLKASKRGSKG